MKTELDPILASALQLCGQEQPVVSLIETLEETQAAYRRRDISKQRAVELIADVMANVTNVIHDHLLDHLETRDILPHGMNVVPMEGCLRLSLDGRHGGVARRIGTRVLDESVGCAVFHPDVGAAIANRPLWTKQNLGRGVGIALDCSDVDIAAALVGRQQRPMYQWIAPDDVFGTVEGVVRYALEEFCLVDKHETAHPGIRISIFGMEPWAGGFYDNMRLEDYLRVRVQPVASEFSFVSPLVDVSCFGMPVGMVYGGASDSQYSRPTYFSWRE